MHVTVKVTVLVTVYGTDVTLYVTVCDCVTISVCDSVKLHVAVEVTVFVTVNVTDVTLYVTVYQRCLRQCT